MQIYDAVVLIIIVMLYIIAQNLFILYLKVCIFNHLLLCFLFWPYFLSLSNHSFNKYSSRTYSVPGSKIYILVEKMHESHNRTNIIILIKSHTHTHTPTHVHMINYDPRRKGKAQRAMSNYGRPVWLRWKYHRRLPWGNDISAEVWIKVNCVKGGWGTEEQDLGGYLSSLFQVLKPGTI